jgi:hypothetical protein
MADDWRGLLTEYEFAVDLFERASRTLTRAMMTSSIPRDQIEVLVNAEAKARDATTAVRLRLINLWRATADDKVNDVKSLSAEVLGIAMQFSELDEDDRVLVSRMIQLVAAAPPSVQDEIGQKLAAPRKPSTQAELRDRVEEAIAYLEERAHGPSKARPQ